MFRNIIQSQLIKYLWNFDLENMLYSVVENFGPKGLAKSINRLICLLQTYTFECENIYYSSRKNASNIYKDQYNGSLICT